jgi:hypothetical protein
VHTTKNNTHRFVISSSAAEFRLCGLIAPRLTNPCFYLLETVTAVVEVEKTRASDDSMNDDTATDAA